MHNLILALFLQMSNVQQYSFYCSETAAHYIFFFNFWSLLINANSESLIWSEVISSWQDYSIKDWDSSSWVVRPTFPSLMNNKYSGKFVYEDPNSVYMSLEVAAKKFSAWIFFFCKLPRKSWHFWKAKKLCRTTSSPSHNERKLPKQSKWKTTDVFWRREHALSLKIKHDC